MRHVVVVQEPKQPNMARIVKAVSHKLPVKSSLNESFVPSRPVTRPISSYDFTFSRYNFETEARSPKLTIFSES